MIVLKVGTEVMNATLVGNIAVTVVTGAIDDTVVWRSPSATGWHHAPVLSVVDLRQVSPAYAQLLASSRHDNETRRSSLLIVDVVGASDDARGTDRSKAMMMGDSLAIKGWPFPQLLDLKFASSYGAVVSCAMPPMYLLDASLAVGGLEGAPLFFRGEDRVIGLLGDAVMQGVGGSRWIVGWDLSIVEEFLGYAPRIIPGRPPVPSSLMYGLSRLVSVHVDDTFGTGFAIGHLETEAIICTNAHVVPERWTSRPIHVRCASDGRIFDAKRWVSFEGIVDLAFLLVRGLQYSTLEPWSAAHSSSPSSWPTVPSRNLIGLPVYAIGYPGNWNPSDPTPMSGPKLAQGHVTSVLQDDLGESCFTTNARIIDGNSGSPIINAQDGRLVGMVSSNAVILSRDGSRTYHPELNFCIPGVLIEELLRKCRVDPDAARQLALARKVDKLIWGTPSRL